jgi:hypothetical protein
MNELNMSVLHYTCLKKLALDKSVLGPFLSYEENEVFWMQTLWPYSQHLIFFITYEWAKYVCYITLAWKNLPWTWVYWVHS